MLEINTRIFLKRTDKKQKNMESNTEKIISEEHKQTNKIHRRIQKKSIQQCVEENKKMMSGKR